MIEPGKNARTSRRRLLAAAGIGLPALALSGCAGTGGIGGRDPFTLGVASGEPGGDGFVIWTRLAPDGTVLADPVAVDWVVAEDERLTRIAAQGRFTATAEDAHSVHVEVRSLLPDRWYWYRFTAAGAASPIGRARTLPVPGVAMPQLSLALASCHRWEQGYYAAWRDVASSGHDLVLFTGDYIYERTAQRGVVRQTTLTEAVDLAGYRARYALYKRDPQLQAAHAACPWIVTWDDHEVSNDYAGNVSETRADPERFRARRAAAYRAFWEHMPLSPFRRPVGADMSLYRAFAFGDLVALQVLDDRQYRDPQPCPRPGRAGSRVVAAADCGELGDPARTMLGPSQEAWLAAQLRRSTTRWNLVTQQTLVSPFNRGTAAAPRWWTDGWDGYPAARDRMLADIAASGAANPLILGGDMHAFFVADVARRPGGPLVATEVVGGSISSLGEPMSAWAPHLPANPHLRFVESERRGYARIVLTRAGADITLRSVADLANPASAVTDLARFRVEAGRPGVLSA